MLDQTSRNKVVCTCVAMGCINHAVQVSGKTVQGKLVAPNTRSKHRSKDMILAEVEADGDQEHGEDGRITDSEDGNEEYSVNDMTQALVFIAAALASWLHTVCGLSRSATAQVLKIFAIVVRLAIEFGQMLSRLRVQPRISLPQDVRTAMSSLSIEPNIIRSICCPKCFKKYSFEETPQVCLYRETKRSKPCGTELWVTRMTPGGPRLVPCRLYNTQDFESWLTFFLSRPGIEDIIDKSYAHRPSPENMNSIWDSPAWKSLGNFTTTRGNLTFSYFIDWFNPFTNKIAGKSVSCGAIMMFCLNLPPELQHLPENTFFAGLTPPPKEPSMTTITAVTDPVVDGLEAMWHGKRIPTHRHPEGSFKRVAVLAAIGDLLAMRKALGYAGVASHNFCSFCTLRLADIENLDYESWTLRTGLSVRAAAVAWHTSSTKKAREKIFAQHGVRWSSLHRLLYRDPVCHTVLGPMHNWLEGVLQHHLRIKWGIGIPVMSKRAKDADKVDSFPASPVLSESCLEVFDMDVDDIDAELEILQAESQQFQDSPSCSRRLRSETSLVLERQTSMTQESESDEDVDFLPNNLTDTESDIDYESEDEWNENTACIFTPGQLAMIRECISEVVIPSWIERPPTNLGEKSHGKLKADHWYLLFTVFLPLIMPEIWCGTKSTKKKSDLLQNFYYLVTCTNILCSFTTTNTSANTYMDFYVKYRKTSRTLFPKVNSRPNHHYAMHNGDLMKYWGPLMLLSEFPYERHNGSLQKIKTNGHIWELDLTMLRQICRRGRLQAFLRDRNYVGNSISGPFLHNLVKDAIAILSPSKDDGCQSNSQVKRDWISDEIYNMILILVNSSRLPSEFLRHFKDLPHPLGSFVLPKTGRLVKTLQHKKKNFSIFSKHPGNSSISYVTRDTEELGIGIITSMWELDIDGVSRTFLVVNSHTPLSLVDEPLNPYSSYPGFLCCLVYEETLPTPVIIEPAQIRSHIPYYTRPQGTFGIQRKTRLLINSLDRSRA